MNGRKLQFIFQGGVAEMEWGRGFLLRDLGKRDTDLISVCDCGRGPLLIYVGCYPFSSGVGVLEVGRSMWKDSTWDVDRTPTILPVGEVVFWCIWK